MADPFVTTDPVVAAAEALTAALRDVLAREVRVRLAVPGGSALKALGPARLALGNDWSRVALTWVDERVVPFDSPDSNRGEAYRSGALDRATGPGIELPLVETGEAADEAVRRVTEGFRADFGAGLDVLLLGMGGDGHVASLFPDRAAPSGLVAHVPDSPKPPASRLTLTYEALGTASTSLVLATGAGKAEAIARLCGGALPASRLRGLAVYTDAAGGGA